MIGQVDEHGRALLEIHVASKPDGPAHPVTTWIDTGFDGHLVFPTTLITNLGLESLADTEAILADGSRVSLETFVGYVDWFNIRIPLQVIANDGKFPLLGTGLLENRVLHIDYKAKRLSLD